jgi:hypothetical protein
MNRGRTASTRPAVSTPVNIKEQNRGYAVAVSWLVLVQGHKGSECFCFDAPAEVWGILVATPAFDERLRGVL